MGRKLEANSGIRRSLHVLLHSWLVTAAALSLAYGEETRCFCDTGDCVQFGYMCKSEALGCYARQSKEGAVVSAVRGCLDPSNFNLCNTTREGGYAPATTNETEPSRPEKTTKIIKTVCCTGDLCNYDVAILADAQISTSNKPDSEATSAPSYILKDFDEMGSLWFKVAVITVPIAGGCILTLLIVMAARILRNDDKHYRMSEARRIETLKALNRGLYSYENRNFPQHKRPPPPPISSGEPSPRSFPGISEKSKQQVKSKDMVVVLDSSASGTIHMV